MRIIGIAAFASFAILLQSGAFAGETGVQQLVKRCESASKARGTSPALCSCTLKQMQEYGFSDSEIVNFLDETSSQRIYMKLNAIWTTALRFD